MAKFNRFEEIQAWQKAYDVTLLIYKVTVNEKFAKDFGLKDQIRRASVSVMANIAEGHGMSIHRYVIRIDSKIEVDYYLPVEKRTCVYCSVDSRISS